MGSRNGLVRESKDLLALHGIVRGIIGRKCWKAEFSYASELILHFGRRQSDLLRAIPRFNLPERRVERGEWHLGTRATPWTLYTPRGIISSKEWSEENEKALQKKLTSVLAGRKVIQFSVSVPDDVLSVWFGDEYLFRITPTWRDAQYDVAYWELFMPGDKIVTYGPGSRWSYQRSDVPMTA
jgi:hypothetical protein